MLLPGVAGLVRPSAAEVVQEQALGLQASARCFRVPASTNRDGPDPLEVLVILKASALEYHEPEAKRGKNGACKDSQSMPGQQRLHTGHGLWKLTPRCDDTLFARTDAGLKTASRATSVAPLPRKVLGSARRLVRLRESDLSHDSASKGLEHTRD